LLENAEACLRATEKLLDVNYKILEIIDVRLTELEDQVESLENQKKKGKLLHP